MASSARPTVQNRGAAPVVGVRVVIEGVVQGVGFRPFVWRTATELGLVGRVRNAAGTVQVEATGSPEAIAAFTARLTTEAPPRARAGPPTVATQRRPASSSGSSPLTWRPATPVWPRCATRPTAAIATRSPTAPT